VQISLEKRADELSRLQLSELVTTTNFFTETVINVRNQLPSTVNVSSLACFRRPIGSVDFTDILIMVALCNKADHYIFVCGFFFLFGYLPYLHTWCGLSVNLGCRSETCCTRVAGNAGPQNRQKVAIWAPSHTLSGYIFATKACIDNRRKSVKQQCLPQMSSQYGKHRPTSR